MSALGGIQGWVLDIDDTLYLERDYVRSGFDVLGKWIQGARGIGGFTETANALFDIGVRGNIFDLTLAKLGVPTEAETVLFLVNLYRQHKPSIRLAPDAEEFLTRASARMPLAVVSDGPFDSQSRKARALKLDNWLSPIVLTEALGPEYRKPSLLAFHLIEKQWGLPGTSLAYVADNPTKDFQGPRALGWRTIRIIRNGALHATIPSPPGLISHQIASFYEIMDMMGSEGK